jgi:hypothetical protein
LHQRCLLALDQALELTIERRELGVTSNVVQRGMVSFVPLVLPDVNCKNVKINRN